MRQRPAPTPGMTLDVLCASLTPDTTGKEFRGVLDVAKRSGPRDAVVRLDCTRLPPPCIARWGFSTAWYGDRTARYRQSALIALGGAIDPDDPDALAASLQAREVAVCETLSRVLLPPDALGEDLWEDSPSSELLPGDFTLGSAFEPRCYSWAQLAGGRVPILRFRGPMPTYRGPRGEGAPSHPFHSDQRAGVKRIRQLDEAEVWAAHGHSASWRRGLSAEGRTPAELSWACAQALPHRSAEALAAATMGSAQTARASVGPDRDEEEACALTRAWLEVRRQEPQDPGGHYLRAKEELQALRAGLGRRIPRGRGPRGVPLGDLPEVFRSGPPTDYPEDDAPSVTVCLASIRDREGSNPEPIWEEGIDFHLITVAPHLRGHAGAGVGVDAWAPKLPAATWRRVSIRKGPPRDPMGSQGGLTNRKSIFDS